MRGWSLSAAILLTASLAQAQTASSPSDDHALLRQVVSEVSQDQLHSTIQHLVGFGTRHTASDTRSNRRGIGAARRWVASQFQAMSRQCGGCLEIQTPSQSFTGDRLPTATEVMDVLAIQRGTSDPDRVIVISGHVDSRVTDPMNATSDAPGANDDGSGSAAVIEAARVLSKHRFAATLVFAVLSGEEQGLYGGKVLADYARAHNWRVEADLNNDIVGNSEGTNGVRDTMHIRVFSEGTRAVETQDEANRRRYNGGEVDSPSRNLARFIDGMADRYLTNFDVRMIYRTDRYGRGGDQVRMLEAGYPSVRVTEAVENYNRQHQDVRVENGIHYGDVIDGVDFAYLAQVARLNIVSMAALASAPAPPSGVTISGAVSSDTTLTWRASPGAASYRVYWRGTTEPQWSNHRDAGAATTLKLENIVIDDYFFGVSAISSDGYESPIVFPTVAGAFFPELPAQTAAH
ncbi:MAG: M20/M25/M40 family metallo-hydrolase [Proteobacteria bacterium]|nr:M20/M25/M40 family metallo-hydrolase [Pseudomonadota bacterium]